MRTFVSERELCHLTHTEALAVAGDKILCIRCLETEGAARQAELADEAVFLDETNRKLRFTSGKAALLLNADAGAAALGKDEDFVEIEGCVAANASGIHHLGHLGVYGVLVTVSLRTHGTVAGSVWAAVSLRIAWDGALHQPYLARCAGCGGDGRGRGCVLLSQTGSCASPRAGPIDDVVHTQIGGPKLSP